MEDYLIQQRYDACYIVKQQRVTAKKSPVRILARVVDLARQMRRVLVYWPSRPIYPVIFLYLVLAIAGAFVPGAVDSDLQGGAPIRSPCVFFYASLRFGNGTAVQGRSRKDPRRSVSPRVACGGLEEVRTL